MVHLEPSVALGVLAVGVGARRLDFGELLSRLRRPVIQPLMDPVGVAGKGWLDGHYERSTLVELLTNGLLTQVVHATSKEGPANVLPSRDAVLGLARKRVLTLVAVIAQQIVLEAPLRDEVRVAP